MGLATALTSFNADRPFRDDEYVDVLLDEMGEASESFLRVLYAAALLPKVGPETGNAKCLLADIVAFWGVSVEGCRLGIVGFRSSVLDIRDVAVDESHFLAVDDVFISCFRCGSPSINFSIRIFAHPTMPSTCAR